MYYNKLKHLEQNISIIIRRPVITRERVLTVLRLAAVLEVMTQVSQPPLLYPGARRMPDVFEAV